MNFKNFKIIAAFLVSFTIISCVAKKKVEKPVEPKTEAARIEPPQGNLVPFTREMFFKLRDNGLDIKRLKFYVDKGITLNKIANTDNIEIDADGKIVKKTGLGENTITITNETAGMIDAVEADGVRVNFGRPNSNLKFINNNASPKFFTFMPDRIDKNTGSNEVNYNSSTYKASSEGSTGLGEIKLMVKELDIELNTGKGTVEPGFGNKKGLLH